MEQSKKIPVITSLISLLVAGSSFAEAPVSDAYSPGESSSKWAIGAGIAAWDNPYINEADDETTSADDGEYDGAFIPRVEYRGERFFSDTGALGFTAFRTGGLSTGFVLGASYSYLGDDDNYDDNSRLAGIEERDPTADLGVYLIHNYENGQLKMTLWQEISNEHDGQSFDLHYIYNFPIGSRWNITPVVGVVWASQENVNHFFGVSESESLASDGIDAYKADSTTSFYGGVSARYEINPHWDIQFGATQVSYGDEIKDSPLIKDGSTFITGFGVNYNF